MDMGRHQFIPLKRLTPSPLNHRKHFDAAKMKELEDSVRVQGVIQPIVARPINGTETFEVVAGERRFRAAKAAGLVDLPAVVRELTDTQALELQVIENGQRVDVHPLEEAEGYEALLACPGADGRKYSVDDVAAKIGKSKAFVYARLKLCALTKKGREAFYAGKLDASRALLLARIPVPELQDEALEVLTGGEYGYGGPEAMSFREAADFIQQRYMLRLKDAPFQTGDAALLPAAGACTACPKRTGNQPELFGDVKGADVCTDPKCFADKKAAHVVKLRAAAEATGQKVITGKEAKKLVKFQQDSPKGYLRLDQEQWIGNNKRKTIGQLLGKDCPPAVLIENPHSGVLMPCVPAADVKDLLKAKLPRQDQADAPDWKKEQRAREEKARRERDFRGRIHEKVRALVVDGVTAEELALIAVAFYEDIWHEHRVKICRLWAADGAQVKRDETKTFEKTIAGMKAAELPRLLVDLAVVKDTHVGGYDNSKAERLFAIARGRGINVERERATFNAELKDQVAKKKAPTAKKARRK